MCKICDQDLPFSSNINKKLDKDNLNRELMASEDIQMLFKSINDLNSNNIISDDSDKDFDLTPLLDCKYVNIDSFKTLKQQKDTFSIIHLNIASLKKHKEEFETILNMLNLM